MRILVTGANGFVGHKIMEMCKDAVACPSLRNKSEDDIRRIVNESGADVIIHTAAISDMRVCESDPDASYKANVIIPTALAKASSDRKLICFSSDQVYNSCESEGPYTESDARPGNVYARHKLEMEERVLDILPSSVMLRAEWMYDFYEGRPDYFTLVLGSDALSFSSGQYRGVTYLKEVTENMERVITLPGGVYNFGSETDRSIYEITSGFLTYLGKNTKLVDAPGGHNLWMDCSKARKYGIDFSNVSNGLIKCAADHNIGSNYFSSRSKKWLTTKGSKIVDLKGNEVWLKGINWFGYNTGENALGGLKHCNLSDMVSQISQRGFNFMRIPVSCELLLQWRNNTYPAAVFDPDINPELTGLNSLEIFDLVLSLCKENGIRVMIDIHSTETGLMGHLYPLWYTDKISENQFKNALAWISDRYKENDTVVAYDIKNEPHGGAEESFRAIWNDSDDDNNWKRFAKEASEVILDRNPHALIVIEGIQIYPKNIETNNFTSLDPEDYYNTWWGGNLMGVRDHPIDLSDPGRNRQIVYSVHEYGPSVFMQPWFEKDYTCESLLKDVWHERWMYLVEEDISPVLIGEWGGFMDKETLKWLKCIRQLIAGYRLNFSFWCLNPESPDTGGLLTEDFKTWDEDKYSLVKEVLDME